MTRGERINKIIHSKKSVAEILISLCIEGDSNNCVCPKCGYKKSYIGRKSCNKLKCPRDNISMKDA